MSVHETNGAFGDASNPDHVVRGADLPNWEVESDTEIRKEGLNDVALELLLALYAQYPNAAKTTAALFDRPQRNLLTFLCDQGLIEAIGGEHRLTAGGRDTLNAVSAHHACLNLAGSDKQHFPKGLEASHVMLAILRHHFDHRNTR